MPSLARLDYKWRVLAVVSLANFSGTLDAGVVSLSLLDMRETLDISTADVLWLLTAYLLVAWAWLCWRACLPCSEAAGRAVSEQLSSVLVSLRR